MLVRISALLLLGGLSGPALAAGACPDQAPLLADAQVRFEAESDEVRPAQRETLQKLARDAVSRQVRLICVYGSIGRREGDPTHRLALDRAEAVAFELRMAGVPPDLIDVVPAAEPDSLLSGFGGEGRRVDILLDP